MSALNAALCRRGIIFWLAAVLLLASRSTHSAPVYDQDTTQIAEYDAATVGCYFNFQRYQEGDRIMTSEPCLNCTCHNRMLMCYLKVCPFTKAIGQDCTVEKRPDQCCPVITCPEVPVQLLTSTTSAPAGSDSTEVGFHDNYGCHVNARFYADGAMLPVDHHNPCELCYCIRNRTTCVMQECTLRVAGCKPVYQPGVCCPIKYDCEYDEESSTTVGPTPGFIMTTTLPPGVLPQCYYENKVYEDGDLINSSQPCQHCYCFRGEIACAVQNCGTPMQAHGKNCTALPPPEGECCPTTYQCEEDEKGVMLPEESEEQLPEQTPHEEQIMTESPMIIDQEDQQVKDEHPQEETFPGADNAIPLTPEGEEEKGVQGIIEHVTKEQIPTTEKLEEQPVTSPTEETAAPKTETTTAEKESTLSSEYDTETSSAAVTPEELATTKVPSEIEVTKTETPTSEQTEESLITETPLITKLPEVSSISEGLQPQEEAITTEHISEEHISTEEGISEKEHSTPVAGKPETSTEIIEKVTSPIAETEESGIVPESVTEQTKEDKSEVETTSGETLATEAELSVEKETATVSHEVPSTEQIETEEPQLTEVSPPKEQPAEEEQIPVTDKDEKEQHPKPEQPTSEHAIIKEEPATVGAKKEDFGFTESPDISKGPVTEEEHVEEESTSEIPAQGPTGIPIPERSPEQKAEDENIYHVTDDYYGVTRPEVSSDNLLTKPSQKPPTTHLPKEPEIPLAPSKETQKPIEGEGIEVPKETVKPISEEVTEINLPTQREPEITEITTEEIKAETTPAITKTEASTETSVTTTAVAEHKPEEKTPEEIEKPSVSEEPETEIPEEEVQSTEKTPSGEEIPTKGLEVSGESSSSEEVSGEQGEKKVQPKKEQPSEEEAGTQFPSTEVETPVFIPGQEHSTVLPSLGEQPIEGEVTTVIPSAAQSTQVPQVEEKTEIVTTEKGKPATDEKPVEENVSEQFITSPSITSGEEEKELQTTESISKEEQTTEAGEKFTTQVPAGEERKTEQPEQYSTEKVPEEPTVTQEIESVEGVPTKIAEQTEATVIRKEPSAETEVKPTDISEIEQTELPVIVEHPTKIGEAEKKGEEKIPVITEIQTEIPAAEPGSTETPILEQQTEKAQTEPSVTGGLPSQPSVPLDRKEDQEFVEPIPSEEEQGGQITQKPSLDEKEVSEIYEEPQKPTISSEVEVTHVPPSEEIITESAPPEEKPTEVAGTTESIGAGEDATEPSVKQQPEVASVQPEEAAMKPPEQKEQTQEPVIKEQPEGILTTSVTPTSEISEEPVTGEKDEGISKSTEATASEGTTISGLISEVSTESLGPVEEHTETEIPIEEQPETHEESTQSSTTEEKPSEEGETEGIYSEVSTEKSAVSETPKVSTQSSTTEEKPSEEDKTEGVSPEVSTEKSAVSETPKVSTQSSTTEEKPSEEGETEGVSLEVSTEKSAVSETPKVSTQSSTTEEKSSEEGETEGVSPEVSTEKSAVSETPEVSISEKQPQEEKGVAKEPTETPEYEVHSTLAPEETPQVKVTTEVSQHSTELPTSIPEKESPTEKESIPEITPRPSGIPGEGNCLVEGQSYNNNSAVPPANFCQTSCRCVSSIVQCELVQCPAPPTHSNCTPVYSAECCPIYACGDISTAELESDSHKVESPETEGEDQKIISTTELLTEAPVTEITVASKESSTVVGEISTTESQPAEITVPSLSPSEKEITATEKQLTTTESVEQPTTTQGRPVEQHPEEHTISPVFETSQESATQVPEEKEHTVPEETTEEAGEAVTKSAVSTEQPVEEQTTASGEEQPVITSTNIPPEQELHGAGERGPTDLHKEEVTTLTASEEQETSTSAEIEISTLAERGEVPTIAPSKEEESTTPIKEQETLSEKDVKEQSTFKPIAEDKTEKPKEEKIQPIPTSEEPITTEEHETSIKPEEETVTEKLPTKPEVLEEQATVEPSEYESTSVSEVQSITEQKPKETEYKEEKEQETVTSTEGEQAVETEKSESQTKLPTTLASDKVEEPVESTTLVHDYASSEASSEDYTTAQSEEVSTEESKGETKPLISTEVPGIEKEHATTPGLASETPGEEPAKPTEESIPEISQKEALPETVEPTEGAAGIEITEHPVEHPELSITEGKPFVTKLPTEPSIVHEPESTQVPIEVHPEITPKTESHTSESPEKQTIPEEVLTTSAPEGEQPTKETVPSLSEEQTEQSVIPEVESETPVIKEEHVTTPTEEQTSKSVEQVSVEEQTVAPATSSESEATEHITPESVTIQEEQKTTDSAKPETELPGLTEEQTAGPETHKEEEEQKPETEIKEEPVTIPEVTEAPKEETTGEAVTPVGITEEHPSVEEHTSQEETTPSKVETDVISQQPIETTTAQGEQSPEEEGQVTSEISLPQHPLSEGTTSQIFEEHPAVSTERPHEYETTPIAEEEVSKPVTEISVEKLSPEKESATTQGLQPEEPVTRISEISPTEKPAEALPETEKPVQQEQETELPEEDETITKPVEGTPEEKLPEELEAEVKPTEAPVSEEEEAHSTAPTPIETTLVQTEEQPSITKLQPTEQYLPFVPPQEIQPTQPEESEEAHTSVTEEGQSRPEESQSTTEHATEIPVTIKTEKLPETEQTELFLEITTSTEGPIKVPGVPTELSEEKTTIKPSPEEPETQAPLRPEEGPQMAETPEEILIKTQSTELPSEITESPEVSPEEEIPPQESEEVGHPHVESTVKPEIDEEHLQPVNHTAETTEPSIHEQSPTSSTSHIPEYPDQTKPVENPHFPEDGGSYLHPDEDYDEDDQIYGPGTCRYGGKVYVSAQQIPRDDPCDFCFCFRSDIICLQQSCPPPIPGCHEEPISGFCCPRYECPVSMATALNLTTTTTTTTTTLPPHFHAHAYKGAARRSGCQIDGHAYRVGEVITSQSGPCTHCICGGDGKMKCEPLVCSPEPMLRQMIAAATAKRRR